MKHIHMLWCKRPKFSMDATVSERCASQLGMPSLFLYAYAQKKDPMDHNRAPGRNSDRTRTENERMIYMRENKMGTMKMPALVLNMSLPLMISLLVQSLYNIVDSIFVARIGEDALTAVSLAYPIQILMIAVSVGTSVGVNALLARSIGAKKYKDTTDIATTGLVLAVAGAVVFLILGLTCVGWFVDMFTDDAVIGGYTRQYLSIVMIFSLGSFIETMYQRFLQAVGNTFTSMITLIVGAGTNIILDPILIFGLGPFPEMGVVGAAVATVIGQWLAGGLAIILNRKLNPTVQVSFRDFHLRKSTLLKIYQVGLPTIITQALGSIMLTAVNAILITFSSTAVAFFGVYYKLQNFLFMPMNGLGQAAIPIVGFNYGAKKYDRIRSMLKIMIPGACVFAVIMSIVFAIFPGQLLSLFSASEMMLELGIPAVRVICGTFIFGAVTIILGYSMSGLGNGIVNMLGTALRQVIILIPAIWILSSMFGVEYAWYAYWISEIIAMIYAVIHSIRIMKKKGVLGEKQSSDVKLQEISQSIYRSRAVSAGYADTEDEK